MLPLQGVLQQDYSPLLCCPKCSASNNTPTFLSASQRTRCQCPLRGLPTALLRLIARHYPSHSLPLSESLHCSSLQNFGCVVECLICVGSVERHLGCLNTSNNCKLGTSIMSNNWPISLIIDLVYKIDNDGSIMTVIMGPLLL